MRALDLSISGALGLFSILNLTCGTKVPFHSIPVEIEQHIPPDLPDHCPLVIFTNHLFSFDFTPVTSRPTMIIDSSFDHLILTSSCNILVLPEFPKVTAPLEEFLSENYLSTNLALIYYNAHGGSSELIIQIKNIRRIIGCEVIMVDLMRNKATKFPPFSFCKGEQDLRCKLKGRRIRVSYSQTLPFFGFTDWEIYVKNQVPIPRIIINSTNPMSQYFYGIEARVLEVLVEEFGMTLEMVAPSDFKYGLLEKGLNGTPYWSGKVGLLQRREVDMCIGSLSLNYERQNVVGEQSSMIIMTRFALASGIPKERHNWDAPLRPFPWMGWTLLTFSVLFVCPMTWYLHKVHRDLTLRITSGTPTIFARVPLERQQSLFEVFGHATSTLLVEPWIKPPRGPVRIGIGGWLLACLILQCIYSSNFTAHLSVPETERQVNTLEDAWELGKQLIVTPGSTVDLFLKSSNDTKVKDLYRRRVTPAKKQLYTLMKDDGNDLVGTMSMDSFSYGVNLLLGPRKYLYRVSPTPFLTLATGWLLAEDDTPIALDINRVIGRAVDTGLITKWRDEMLGTITEAWTSESGVGVLDLARDNGEKPLSFHSLDAVFLLWVIGLSLGVLVFILENLVYLTQLKNIGYNLRIGVNRNRSKFQYHYLK